ncbi:hypothetical protein QBC39DRAFT_366948 [Podospora conica]|nr:hypothetical protein QBC39DRAFT_366948 [Schizothecium conicum]
MPALHAQLAITHICHALTAQEKVVANLQAEFESLKELDEFVDLERAIGYSLDHLANKVQAARIHQQHLQGKLENAINFWYRKRYDVYFGEPWVKLRQPAPVPEVVEPPTNAPIPRAASAPELRNDPMVTIAARRAQEVTGPTVRPSDIFPPPPPQPRVNVRIWRKHAWWMGAQTQETVEVQPMFSRRRSVHYVRHCPQRPARQGYVAPRDRYQDELLRQDAMVPNRGFRWFYHHNQAPADDFDPHFWEKELNWKQGIFGDGAGLFERPRRAEEARDVSPGTEVEGGSSAGHVEAPEVIEYVYGTGTSVGEYSSDSSWSSASEYELFGQQGVELGEEMWREVRAPEWQSSSSGEGSSSSGGTTSDSDGGSLKVPNFEDW